MYLHAHTHICMWLWHLAIVAAPESCRAGLSIRTYVYGWFLEPDLCVLGLIMNLYCIWWWLATTHARLYTYIYIYMRSWTPRNRIYVYGFAVVVAIAVVYINTCLYIHPNSKYPTYVPRAFGNIYRNSRYTYRNWTIATIRDRSCWFRIRNCIHVISHNNNNNNNKNAEQYHVVHGLSISLSLSLSLRVPPWVLSEPSIHNWIHTSQLIGMSLARVTLVFNLEY